jgi:HSP20 family molecular chaperone IbpA
MWARAQELLEEAARIQRRLLVHVEPERVPSWAPPVDLFETPSELWVIAALPGVESEQAEVGIDESGALVIRARRELPANLSRARLLHLEIPFGYFERRVTLPPGRYRVLESVLADGLLRLRLQKEGGP